VALSKLNSVAKGLAVDEIVKFGPVDLIIQLKIASEFVGEEA
jgi:hypothetical protein